MRRLLVVGRLLVEGRLLVGSAVALVEPLLVVGRLLVGGSVALAAVSTEGISSEGDGRPWSWLFPAHPANNTITIAAAA